MFLVSLECEGSDYFFFLNRAEQAGGVKPFEVSEQEQQAYLNLKKVFIPLRAKLLRIQDNILRIKANPEVLFVNEAILEYLDRLQEHAYLQVLVAMVCQASKQARKSRLSEQLLSLLQQVFFPGICQTVKREGNLLFIGELDRRTTVPGGQTSADQRRLAKLERDTRLMEFIEGTFLERGERQIAYAKNY